LKGILFNTEMVRAVLDGRKTQTRRPLKSQPPEDYGLPLSVALGSPEIVDRRGELVPGKEVYAAWWEDFHIPAPYKPGDVLYVREKHSFLERTAPGVDAPWVWYWADGQPEFGDWTLPRPSIHMPRSVARIWLRVDGVRCERLLDISDADALQEGIPSPAPSTMFSAIWRSIYGEGSWIANPFIWVIEFSRMEAPK
jgi:hypothetical protein